MMSKLGKYGWIGLMVVGLIFGLIGIAMLIAGIVLVSQCRQAYYYYSSYYCNTSASAALFVVGGLFLTFGCIVFSFANRFRYGHRGSHSRFIVYGQPTIPVQGMHNATYHQFPQYESRMQPHVFYIQQGWGRYPNQPTPVVIMVP